MCDFVRETMSVPQSSLKRQTRKQLPKLKVKLSLGPRFWVMQIMTKNFLDSSFKNFDTAVLVKFQNRINEPT